MWVPSGNIWAVAFVESMDTFKSKLKRCKVLKVMSKFESIFKWQIIAAEHVEEEFFIVNMFKQSDSDSNGEGSWVS